MRWPWQKSEPEPPVVRPIYQKPITEFEAKRLARKGQWLTIKIQVTPNGSWVNWRHDIPSELNKEAKDALIALALELSNSGSK